MGDLVDGYGWISDESDFYGSAENRRKLHKQSNRVDVEYLDREWKEMQSTHPATMKVAEIAEKPRVAPQQLYNMFEGDLTGRQLNETILQFLRRMPPLTSDGDGAWIWISNPVVGSKGKQGKRRSDVVMLQEVGSDLLEQFDSDRQKIEKENPGKVQSTVTRKLGPYRDRLKENILDTAIKHGVTSGKWMLFPTEDDVTQTWRTVCEAMIENKLGEQAKVAIEDHSRRLSSPDAPFTPNRLICIYTYDFSDLEDVRRVLDELVDLGLVSREGRGIYYKCDAYTYLGIESNNPYKLKASLYSSSDLLKMSKPTKALVSKQTQGKISFAAHSKGKPSAVDAKGKASFAADGKENVPSAVHGKRKSNTDGWLF